MHGSQVSLLCSSAGPAVVRTIAAVQGWVAQRFSTCRLLVYCKPGSQHKVSATGGMVSENMALLLFHHNLLCCHPVVPCPSCPPGLGPELAHRPPVFSLARLTTPTGMQCCQCFSWSSVVAVAAATSGATCTHLPFCMLFTQLKVSFCLCNCLLADLFFRTTDCLRYDQSKCVPPGDENYDITHSGLDAAVSACYSAWLLKGSSG